MKCCLSIQNRQSLLQHRDTLRCAWAVTYEQRRIFPLRQPRAPRGGTTPPSREDRHPDFVAKSLLREKLATASVLDFPAKFTGASANPKRTDRYQLLAKVVLGAILEGHSTWDLSGYRISTAVHQYSSRDAHSTNQFPSLFATSVRESPAYEAFEVVLDDRFRDVGFLLPMTVMSNMPS